MGVLDRLRLVIFERSGVEVNPSPVAAGSSQQLTKFREYEAEKHLHLCICTRLIGTKMHEQLRLRRFAYGSMAPWRLLGIHDRLLRSMSRVRCYAITTTG